MKLKDLIRYLESLTDCEECEVKIKVKRHTTYFAVDIDDIEYSSVDDTVEINLKEV
jgi:hypothetical protein